ncbi:GtrA family protein [Couchioplanes caeruleus]|uniref:GtrA family protein n=1 Tax=Couchioplanes caeruleus TaxID=56438 RepID=UPI0020C159A7|nr:GtrA family protein [Couchioplanes caeruleus]UQU65623.1 GtrA family protein [Couchioplanes caeruleus]
MTGAGTLGSVPVADVLPALRARFGALVRELSKFGTVGAVAFTIDLVIFNVLLQGGLESLLAKTISTVVATTVAFAGNRFWTWRHRDHRNMARQYTMFFLLNGIGLGIGLACLAISHYGLGSIWPEFQSPLADNISGQLVGTAVGTLFRFWSYRRFVFGDRIVPDPVVPAAPETPAPPTGTAAPQSTEQPAPRAVPRM